MTMIIVAGIILIAIIGSGMMIKNMRAKTEAEADSSGPKPQTKITPDQEYETILASLLKLNILLRKDPDMLDEMTIKIEEIIDDLTIIIPPMMERYPGETLTYEVKKIGREHLHKTVKEYLDLSTQSRENQYEIFKKTIDNLHEVSHRSRDIVEKNETAEFKTMANFLAGKFS